MILIFILVAALLFMTVISALLGWYLYKILKKYAYFSEDIEDFRETLEEYHAHVKILTELETFYGDEVLMNLLRHSMATVREVAQFSDSYSLSALRERDEEMDNIDEHNEEEEDGYTTEEETDQTTATGQGKIIFY